MAGPTTAAEKKRASEPETLLPLTTMVPIRRGESGEQVAQIRAAYDRVDGELKGLQQYSAGLRVPPSGKTTTDVKELCDRLDAALNRMALTGIPILGLRYSDEVELIRSDVLAARKAAGAGKLGDSTTLSGRAEARMNGMGTVFGIEMSIVMGGVPPNLRINGMRPDESLDAILDSVEAGLLDVGTRNEARAKAIWDLAGLYGANAAVYNIENDAIRSERDNLLGLLAARGRDARRGKDYTKEDEGADRRAIREFTQNLDGIRKQITTHNAKVMVSWSGELLALIRTETELQGKKRLEDLRNDVNAMLDRMNQGKKVSDEEIRTLTSRYMLLTGRRAAPSEDERTERLTEIARGLRGSAKTVLEGSVEWFGQRALAFLDSGKQDLASLAISMGMLEGYARSAGKSGRDYLDSRRITDIISGSLQPSVGMLSQFYLDASFASALAQMDALELQGGRKGGLAQVKLIANSGNELRKRADAGDLEGVKRVLIIVSVYIDTLERNKWKPSPGQDNMEKAIAAEISGKDSTQLFQTGLRQSEFVSSTDQNRALIGKWGRGEYKTIAENSANRVDELAASGKVREAEALLTRLLMFIDCVEKIGPKAGPSQAGQRMGTAINAMIAGKSEVDGRPVDSVFMEGFNASQGQAVAAEADRLALLAGKRPEGAQNIRDAIQAARKRMDEGDNDGAFLLLRYVSEFYGSAEKGKAEGWRYKIATNQGKSYAEALSGMLDAIAMEALADTERAHVQAARMFEGATLRLAEAEALRTNFTDMRDRYMGIAPFVSDNPRTKGRIQVAVMDDGTPKYMELADIRNYEKANQDDPGLGKGPTLAQLLARCESAFRNGDIRGYKTATDAFAQRFDIVRARVAREDTIMQLRTQLTQMEKFIGSLPQYRDAPGALSPERRALETRRRDMLARLDALERSGGELGGGQRKGEGTPFLADYTALLGDLDRERRISIGAAQLAQEIAFTDRFIPVLKMETPKTGLETGQLASRALSLVQASMADLEGARRLLISGDLASAEKRYQLAVQKKTDAMVTYSAENAITFREAISAHRVHTGQWGLDERFGYGALAKNQRMMREFELYSSMRTGVFHEVLFGKESGDPKTHGERIANAMRGASLMEVSIFAIPADSTANFFSDFRAGQAKVRQHIAVGDIDKATAALNEMQDRAESNKWKANVALIATGVLVSSSRP